MEEVMEEKDIQKKWTHQTLDPSQKDNVVEMYDAAVSRSWLFRLLTKSPDYTRTFWPLISLSSPFLIAGFHCNFLLAVIFTVFGILASQASFIIQHLQAHAKFLEYDMISIKHQRMRSESVLFWIAFYHHHHQEHKPRRELFSGQDAEALFESAMKRFTEANWAPQLSYHNEQGKTNVLMSHWSGFSLWGHWYSLLFVASMCWLLPSYAFFVFGYELVVLLLPGAHAFQHWSKNEFPGWMLRLFEFLASSGWFATDDTHKPHHDHFGPTVYQSFTSSGFYWPALDEAINRFWDAVFFISTHEIGNRPWDIFGPYIHQWFVLIFGVPACFCLLSDVLRSM
jgi:hypothetical protein